VIAQVGQPQLDGVVLQQRGADVAQACGRPAPRRSTRCRRLGGWADRCRCGARRCREPARRWAPKEGVRAGGPQRSAGGRRGGSTQSGWHTLAAWECQVSSRMPRSPQMALGYSWASAMPACVADAGSLQAMKSGTNSAYSTCSLVISCTARLMAACRRWLVLMERRPVFTEASRALHWRLGSRRGALWRWALVVLKGRSGRCRFPPRPPLLPALLRLRAMGLGAGAGGG
jgi:hypothetical protein